MIGKDAAARRGAGRVGGDSPHHFCLLWGSPHLRTLGHSSIHPGHPSLPPAGQAGCGYRRQVPLLHLAWMAVVYL